MNFSLARRIRHWLQDHNPLEDKSVRSARRRLRESNALFGASNPEIRQVHTPDGQPAELTSTIKAYPETTEEPSGELLGEIQTASAELPYLMQAFLGSSIPNWTLHDLDHTFSAWQRAQTQGRFTSEKVVQILGAAFGEYCNQHLKMRWLIVTDAAGRQLAVRSTNNRVTGWPHSTIRKRVKAHEHEFFVTVYELLRRSVEESYAD